MTTTFAHLGLPDQLVRGLDRRGLTEPFPVQAATIPDALAGRDVCGKAPTGSGKTLAFGLPVLANVRKADRNRPRALVLAPTRELAEQIKEELSPLARAMKRHVSAVYGGVGYGPQKNALRKGVDILVATPGRLEDLIEQGCADLSRVELVVLDEADRMADMGFMPAVRRILDQTSDDRQTLLFSATLDGEVAVLSRKYQRDPVRHEAGEVEPDMDSVDHHFWLVRQGDRVQHAADLVRAAGRSIVFTRTRRRADRLAKQISDLGLEAVALHGGRSQGQRTRALKAFSSGRAQALVATDVAARGIHIDAVASVVHFDPPADSKDYVHRSGRTARAGASGTVVSLLTSDERRAVRRLQRDLDLQSPIGDPQLDAVHAGTDRAAVRPNGREHGGTRPPRPSHRDHTPRETGPKPTSVYVANLPWEASRDDLQDLFEQHGTVHDSTIITDKRSGRSKGFGFVDMPVADAKKAVAALNATPYGGRDLTVRLARPRSYGN